MNAAVELKLLPICERELELILFAELKKSDNYFVLDIIRWRMRILSSSKISLVNHISNRYVVWLAKQLLQS
jgi:hypothetical protein